MMAIGYESPDENYDDEQYGGRLSAQNARVMDRLYNPKQSQSQFTGQALLDTGTKRLRPKQAMDFWSTKKVEQKLRERPYFIIMYRSTDVALSPREPPSCTRLPVVGSMMP